MVFVTSGRYYSVHVPWSCDLLLAFLFRDVFWQSGDFDKSLGISEQSGLCRR